MKFIDFAKKLDIDFDKIISETMQEPDMQAALIDYNQNEQLAKGLDAKGQHIETIGGEEAGTGSYSPYTMANRAEKGLQTNNVDLKVTGYFWNTFFVESRAKETEIKANFQKGSDNILYNFDKKYDFLGLINENLKGFVTWNFLESFAKRVLLHVTR